MCDIFSIGSGLVDLPERIFWRRAMRKRCPGDVLDVCINVSSVLHSWLFSASQCFFFFSDQVRAKPSSFKPPEFKMLAVAQWTVITLRRKPSFFATWRAVRETVLSITCT